MSTSNCACRQPRRLGCCVAFTCTDTAWRAQAVLGLLSSASQLFVLEMWTKAGTQQRWGTELLSASTPQCFALQAAAKAAAVPVATGRRNDF